MQLEQLLVRAAQGHFFFIFSLMLRYDAEPREGVSQQFRDMLAPTDYEITEVESGGARGGRKAATRSYFDGYPVADHGRLHRHSQNQSRSYNAIDSDNRGHLLCAQW